MLHAFFTQLTTLKTFHVQASTLEGKREAYGTLNVAKSAINTLITYEKGTWNTGENFTSSFSWDFDFEKSLICLSRRRFSPSPPIFLCELIPGDDHTLKACKPHLCGQDEYTIELNLHTHHVSFIWHITGPKKTSTLTYCYGFKSGCA